MSSNLSYSSDTPNSGQNRRFFLSRVTLKFDRWPWKIIGHLTYATSSFVHHFITIGVFKLELESGNVQFGSKSMIFVPCDLEISQMTLENNMAPLLSHIKLYASFHCHMWIQTGVTVRIWLNWVLTSVTLTFDLWPWHFAWTSLLSLVITPKISQWYDEGNMCKVHVKCKRCDRQTDGRTHGRTEVFLELLSRN